MCNLRPCATPAPPTPAPTIHCVMADWGGQETKPFTTLEETTTAKGMGLVAASIGASNECVD